MSVVFAFDISGSTGGNSTYWNYVERILNSCKSKITKYIQWDGTAHVIDLNNTMRRIQDKKGYGGTEPSSIVHHLQKGDELILVTDGEVTSASCIAVSKLMQSVQLSACHAHIINPRPDVSVVCGFTRGIESTVTTYCGSKVETITRLKKEDFQIVDELENLTMEQFIDKYTLIHQVLLNKMVGIQSMDTTLHNLLVALKKKMVKEFISTLSNTHDIHSHLVANNYTAAKLASQAIIDEYYGNSPVNLFSAKFDTLIGIVSGKTTFSTNQYNAIPTNTFATAQTVSAEEPETLSIENVQLMECPIMMSDDAMVIPILEGEPILYGEDKKVIDQVIKNPLSILSYSHLVDKMKARLSPHIGLFSYCALHKSTRQHPLTRVRMSGCIPLGASKEYVNEATKAIMHLFTGGKIVGNADLYFAVVYFVCKDIEFLSSDTAAFRLIQEQMVYRMNFGKTAASLSGMAELVGTKLLFKEAIWFVLTSGDLFKDNSTIPIRQHAFVQDKLLELNALNGYPISETDLQYCHTTRLMLSMLHSCKKDPTFYNKIRALYQDGIVVKGAEPEEENIWIFFSHSKDLSHCSEAELKNIKRKYWITKEWIHPSKSAADITVSVIDTDLVRFPVFKNVWGDSLDPSEYRHYNCEICPLTCRPLYRMKDGRTWVDSYEQFYRSAKMLSLNKYFGSFVTHYKQYPTPDQLMLYVWKRETGKGETTISLNIKQACVICINDYDSIINTISPEVFSQRFEQSVNRVVREQTEGREALKGSAEGKLRLPFEPTL